MGGFSLIPLVGVVIWVFGLKGAFFQAICWLFQTSLVNFWGFLLIFYKGFSFSFSADYFLLYFLLGLVGSRGVLEMTIIGRSVDFHWASQLLDNILDVHLFLHCRSFLCALRCRIMVDFFLFNFLIDLLAKRTLRQRYLCVWRAGRQATRFFRFVPSTGFSGPSFLGKDDAPQGLRGEWMVFDTCSKTLSPIEVKTIVVQVIDGNQGSP